MLLSETSMMLPRGSLEDNTPLILRLEAINKAEKRLGDVRLVNPETAGEMMGSMNLAANDTAKYMAYIQYELLMAKKNFDKRKAILILDEFPEYLKKNNIKPNEDVREAFIIKDDIAFQLRDRIDCLTAALYGFENKMKSFVRAFNASKTIAESRRSMASAPIMSPGPKPWQILDAQDNQFQEENDNE